MTQEFESWTAYDDWLVQNYNNYDILELNEIDGKIVARYEDKNLK